MKENNQIKIYNVLFPIWLLIWIPSWLWLLLIPGNYIIDTAVTYFTLPKEEGRWKFCMRHTWKICIAGFAADLVGSGLLFAAEMCSANTGIDWIDKASYAMNFNPFTSPAALLICVVSIGVSALIIYLVDRKILTRAGLTAEQARRSAMWLAIITAPYLFLIPSGLFYN